MFFFFVFLFLLFFFVILKTLIKTLTMPNKTTLHHSNNSSGSWHFSPLWRRKAKSFGALVGCFPHCALALQAAPEQNLLHESVEGDYALGGHQPTAHFALVLLGETMQKEEEEEKGGRKKRWQKSKKQTKIENKAGNLPRTFFKKYDVEHWYKIYKRKQKSKEKSKNTSKYNYFFFKNKTQPIQF